ncbi:MAG TPA: hypothetical protein VMT28_18115 [Terriglobales bacterium]|jgi:hypothetical protein|nr:hypothetical protein [Terriglobales bacterium]
MILNFKARMGQAILWTATFACLGARAAAADVNIVAPSLDSGFRLMYDLEFDQAHRVFSSWQAEHPDDPVGLVSDAAGLLFSEFNRLGVLEGQFYEDDHTFQARKKLLPDPAVRERFDTELSQAEDKARARLAANAKDRDALFAMALASGLRADYAALIEKSNFTALRYTKEATRWADQLLAVDPDCYDAHLASGISQYIIGSMAAPMRWILRLGGVSGDKKAGIEELQVTAQHGHYLGPFARILLAIAYVREKDKTRAREMLESLRGEFPGNPLFAHELTRLETGP